MCCCRHGITSSGHATVSERAESLEESLKKAAFALGGVADEAIRGLRDNPGLASGGADAGSFR